jgi:hypothetical protein
LVGAVTTICSSSELCGGPQKRKERKLWGEVAELVSATTVAACKSEEVDVG